MLSEKVAEAGMVIVFPPPIVQVAEPPEPATTETVSSLASAGTFTVPAAVPAEYA